MRRAFFFIIFFILLFANFSFGADCPIYPVPKEYRSGPFMEITEKGAVVLGAQAGEQEKYAADRLVKKIALRYRLTLPVILEKDLAGHDPLIVLGTTDSNKLLADLCRKNKIDLSRRSPGFNGFVIQTVSENDRRIVLIGGSDSNGLIYGQEAFFDLMRKQEGKTGVESASIRDWPSIPWRGRPHSVLKHHLRPGELDEYVRARLNFSDLRDNPEIKETLLFDARKSSMGFPPGKPLDKDLVSKMITESHRRGIFLYATVSCSVKRSEFGLLQKTYEDLLALGADGIWVSMDDTGGGDDPVELVKKIMSFCKSHGITGRKIAFTPPLKEYQTIDRPLNHQLAKLPVFDQALWYFTRVPCNADREMTEKMGLKNKPGWWYNYVETGKVYDPKGGFLNTKWLVTTTRKNGRPGYMVLQPINWGWGFPDFDQLRDAAQNTSQVHLWGLCGGWPTEYALGMFGLWAWNPEQADFNRACRSIYRYVYGDALVETMINFDKKYAELKKYFVLPGGWSYRPEKQWPRLIDPKDRKIVLEKINELEKTAIDISRKAFEESALDRDRLEYCYLEPMRASLVYARKFAAFDFPEYEFGSLAEKYLAKEKLKKSGQKTRRNRSGNTGSESIVSGSNASVSDDKKNADQQTTRKKILGQLLNFKKEFSELKGDDQYIDYWKKIVDSEL